MCSSERDGLNEVNVVYSRCSVHSERSALYPVNAQYMSAKCMRSAYVDLISKPLDLLLRCTNVLNCK